MEVPPRFGETWKFKFGKERKLEKKEDSQNVDLRKTGT